MKTLIPLLLLLGSCCIVYGQKNAVIGTMVSKPHAILVLNPPNSDQGFLLPQLTTSQRQSITPASPGEDGLIVFDTTDKSFYYWKNNAWVKGLGTDGTAVPTLAYDAGTQKLSLSTGGEVNLSALKEIPSMTSSNGKFLTTDGATLSWATVSALGDISNIIAGAGLTGGATSGDATLSVNTDGVTLGVNGSNQLELKNGAVSTGKLAAGAVTPTQLATDAVTTTAIQAGAVTNAKIAPNAVAPGNIASGGNNKILTTDATGVVIWTDQPAASTDDQALSFAGSTLAIDRGNSVSLSASGQVAGALNNLVVQNDVITSVQLANDAVGASELANGAVDAAAIQGGVIGTTHLVSGGNSKVLTTDAAGLVMWADRTSFNDDNQNLSLSGNTLNIDNGASADLGALSATGQVAGPLNNLVVQNDVITSAQLANDAVGTAELANDAVGAAELANGSVDGAALQSGVVATTHLVSGGNNKVLTTDATGVVNWADRTSFTDAQDLSLTGNTLNIDNGASANLNTLTASGQVAGALNNLVVQNDVITASQLANDAVGAAELANGAVDGAALQTGVVGTTHLVSGGNSKVLTTDPTGVVGWADRTSFTDAQDLSLTGNTLNIDNGASANLNTLTASGQVAGALNNLVVQNDVITASQLANDAVGAAELANGAVDGTAIQSGVVSTTHLVSGGNSKVLTTDATGVVGWADRTSFTDAQDLSLTGNTLNIDNGTSANLNTLTASGQVAGALNNLVVQNDVITSAQLANDAVGAAELANGAVDAAAIQNSVIGTVHLVSGGNSKVLSTDAGGAVVWSDRASFTDSQNLSLTGNTLSIDNGTSANLNGLIASGQVAGALNNLVVQNDVITSAQLANDAVGAAELANGAVDAAAIQNDVITAAQLASDAVGAAELANGAVDAAAIQNSVVGTAHVVSGGNNKVMTTDATGVVAWADRSSFTDDNQNLSLSGNTLSIDNGTSADLNALAASGQVAGALNNLVVQNDVITSAQLANDAVGAAELANGSVDAAAIQNDVITAAQLANDAVGAAELANNAVDANAIQTGVVNTTHLASGGNNKVMTTDATGVVNWADRTTLPVAGDVTGTLGAATVTKLQSRDIAATAPGAGEALVWNGTAWAPQAITVTPTTQYYAIDPANFTALQPTNDNKTITGFFEGNNTFVTANDKGDQLIAPVNLPHNASIDGVTVYYLNNDVLLLGTIKITLYRKSFTGGNQQLATTTVGLSLTDATVNLPAVPAGSRIVDNSTYSYRIVVELTDSATGVGALDTVQRIYGIRIQYSK